MKDSNRYRVYPDRVYKLIYEDMVYEVTGQEIVDRFRREASLIKDMKKLYDKYPELFEESDTYPQDYHSY
jgi:hypothetical protein